MSPNMSYCRYENTLHDLQDCYEALQEETLEDIEHLDNEEGVARNKLIALCTKIHEEFGGDQGVDPDLVEPEELDIDPEGVEDAIDVILIQGDFKIKPTAKGGE
jgi:hypothetical protein